MSSFKLNRMASSIAKMESYLPKAWHPLGYSFIFNSMVKMAGAAGLRVDQLSQREVQVTLKNRRRVQNHIGGLHACAMVLAAESATGMVVAMNVPDTHLPLMKAMKVNFVRRCQGNIQARATLSEEDYQRIHTEEKGDVVVPVVVTDASDNEPIVAEMVWAWVAKDRSKKKDEKQEQK
jgi:acyl-coenzyme A thioesterase PaaI-like protein